MASKHGRPRTYSVQYTKNNSKRWDGRVIDVDADWLELLYKKEELVPGKEVQLPWQGKKSSSVQQWNAVVVDSEASATPSKEVTCKLIGKNRVES